MTPTDTNEGRSASIALVIALAVLTNMSAMTGTIAPALVEDYISFGLSVRSATSLITFELAGMTGAVFLLAPFTTRLPLRRTATLALIAIAGGQAASMVIAQYAPLAIGRMFVGAGSGVAATLALAQLARLPKPERNFALVVISNLVAGTVLLAAVSLLASGTVSRPALTASLVLVLLTACALAFLPRGVSAPEDHAIAPAVLKPDSLGIIGILALLTVASSFGATWPLIGQIGLAAGTSSSSVAAALPIAALAALVVGGLMIFVAPLLARRWAILGGSTALAVAFLSPVLGTPFLPSIIAMMMLWVFSLPFYLGLLAALDRSGRTASLAGGIIPLGIIAGQLVATLSLQASLQWVSVFSAVAAFVSGAVAFWLERRA